LKDLEYLLSNETTNIDKMINENTLNIFFKNDRGLIKNKDMFEDEIRRNGTIFLYEKIDSQAPVAGPEAEGSVVPGSVVPPAAPAAITPAAGEGEGRQEGEGGEEEEGEEIPLAAPPAAPPATQGSNASVPQAITPENTITEATRIAKKLFGIPDGKTVDKKDLKRRYEQLKYKIDKYNSDTQNLIREIIKNANTFLVLIPQSLTRFDPTYKDKLKSFFNRLSSADKTALIKFSENFVPQYKALTFKQSTIELKPKILDKAKTEKINKLCNSVSKLSRQIYTRKIIPSQLPNLLEKKDVPETKKIFISDRKER